MNKKSILMPHSCQIAGWCLLALSFLIEIAKVLFVHDINVAWYFAKGAHITLIVSLFFILYYGLFKYMIWKSNKQ